MAQCQLLVMLDQIFGKNSVKFLVTSITMEILIPSLADKTVEELQETITSLTSKLTFAHRTGNPSID